ncbi:u3 small nucleolar RNA interacting protein [Anaeramoeba ignava]|uniref:U3 small nucleolar RNA interacting protein n=1 Tax=Anaeramoeba ignava TaxID=1746090 RepID=A0A9Q0LA44_ANAIG|nr:u3 small nucleolar RNA interacting protein [Anaeramoeba ignava]
MEKNIKFEEFGEHVSEVRCLHLHDQYLYSGSFDCKIIKWEIETKKKCWTFTSSSYVFYLQVHSNLLYLANSSLQALDINTGKVVKTFESNLSEYIYGFKIIEDRIYRVGGDRLLKEFDIVSNQFLREAKFDSPLWSIEIYGTRIFVGASSNFIIEYDLDTFEKVHTYQLQSSGVWGLAQFSNKLYIGASSKIYKLDLTKNSKEVISWKNQDGTIVGFQIYDGILFSGDEHSEIYAWDLSTEKNLYSFKNVSSCWCVSSNSTFLFSGSTDHKIRKWEISSLFYHLSYIEDFKNFYKRQELCDTKYYTSDGTISFHKLIVKARLNCDFEKLRECLSNKTTKIVNQFLKWIYTGKSKDEVLIQDILKELSIEKFDELNQVEGLRKSLSNLYNENSTKDFIIIAQNQRVYVHKEILHARSDLFRGMFLSVNDSTNQVNDYSNKSVKTIQAFVYFLYHDQFNPKLMTKRVRKELQDAVDFYQLNPQSVLPNELQKFQKK